ncbi:hypothetical protein SBA5_160065 [Candidatus Sulfotelmatomonas gaucii]|uniref:Uncharacterized protein n=1 Tax=Candidatus Sulfuritelmatomonas gaucii TaxID=2043161 RepID=A0A2N9L5R4_9BACT|nr:hypothetical protein SBA5_160065 [Candidatus Sulfotelmatomonas gaucii]
MATGRAGIESGRRKPEILMPVQPEEGAAAKAAGSPLGTGGRNNRLYYE